MILVSGGTGLLGSHLLFYLISKGEKVRALKRENSNINNVLKIFSYYSDNANELFNKIEWFDADILDSDSIIESMIGIKQVYHTAAIVSFNPNDKEKMIKTNISGTANMVNAAIANNIEKFCHVSSISALGDTDDIITEETFRKPGNRYSGYSISKYRSELEVWRGITEGLNAVIVNPSIILGAGNWTKGSSSIFYNLWKGMRFYSSGSTGYVDIEDVIKIMIYLMESDINNERFIVSTENLAYKDVFNKISDSLGIQKPTIYANSFVLSLAWRLNYLFSLFSGKSPKITKEIASSAQTKSVYSNEKTVNVLSYRFLPINESINKISALFKNDFI
ncbi:MAG: NAD-dependent epimerase/dehydratase family protein [Bacteroidales bacterium]|nr:NAD-dependent epimerase/dehydratase family protein [Bacteroidales bacterium]MBN2755935.1 NAD-dependent epimerase/dehydratase family protein [Bacteroidales bacterium]